MEAIAITGTGIVSALGCSVEKYWAAMLADESGISLAPWCDPERDGGSVFWGTVTDFDPLDWMDEKIADGTDMFAQMALAASQQAMEQAGLHGGGFDAERLGVVHGTSGGGVRAFQKAQYMLDTEGPQAVPRKTQLQVWANMAAGQIALRYRLHGPSLTVTTACASSLDAIGTAARLIRAGDADVVIAGGTEGGISAPGGKRDGDFVPAMYYAGGAYGMEGASDDPRRVMLPFDVKRQGIVVGEGSSMLVLERESHAKARGAKILGYLRGYGSLSDSFHPSSPDPSGQWEAKAMEKAIRSADMSPSDVGGLAAHATATPKGDTAEINAINIVHGKGRTAPLPVTATKGHFGHSGASSGGMSLIALLKGMHEGTFVHTSNIDEPDPAAEFEVVHGTPKQLDYDVAQINSFGFGGQNASVVISRS
ncbi:MAG: beta-ketoacyl-[acyl-carrier-protein] synthase family protein [Minwuia sp.]|uniref:beta-ketoacyl-[acyl-carrier-protein] synthase family protein n=1 Tax=Minwuia sp. TaxID=2493630 RepID=UPI003A84EFD8